MSKEVKYTLGEKLNAGFCPPSEVVGIDRYTLKAFDGDDKNWTSYTLTSAAEGPFSRWWIVNMPVSGPHYFIAGKDIPENAAFDPAQSGLVGLESEGDAALSSPKGALAVYKAPDNALYAQEVFDGADRIVFVGKPL